MDLSQLIKNRIDDEGPISFRDFMDMSLYHPGLGYYTSSKRKIGANGDYYTSPWLTPAFGAMIGRQLEEMWHFLGQGPFVILEYGGGNGCLCYDILTYLENNQELFDNLEYRIIEKNRLIRQITSDSFRGKVTWHASIKDMSDITGVILSNELVDNFPVHQVVMKEEIMEVFVGYNNAGFCELLKPASKAVTDYMEELNIDLPNGYRTEINLDAFWWMKKIASSLKRGYVLTIDYGYRSAELYRDRHSTGTLLCYHKHQLNDNPYFAPGEQDITTHVNFSALHHFGLKNGLEFCGYTDQAHFLLSLGITEHLRKSTEMDADNHLNYRQEAFLKRTLLIDMGNKFKVLIQRKGVPEQQLQGLKLFNAVPDIVSQLAV